MAAFWDEMQRRVEALPGVTGVAFADGRPPEDVDNFNNFELEAFPTSAGNSQPVTPWVSVTPKYFAPARPAPGRRDACSTGMTGWGRTSSPSSSIAPGRGASSPAGARWGKRLHEGGCTSCPWVTVIGVVSEVKYAGLDKP